MAAAPAATRTASCASCAARSVCSPRSSRTIAATVPATPVTVPESSPFPMPAGASRHEPAPDGQPDRLQRARRLRGALPGANPARRLGLPDARRRPGHRGVARPCPPCRRRLSHARAAAARRGRVLDTVGPMHLLIVDDDRALRDALRRALTLAGYDVDTADGGEQALAKIAQQSPDALVLDIGMP